MQISRITLLLAAIVSTILRNEVCNLDNENTKP